MKLKDVRLLTLVKVENSSNRKYRIRLTESITISFFKSLSKVGGWYVSYFNDQLLPTEHLYLSEQEEKEVVEEYESASEIVIIQNIILLKISGSI